MKDNCTSLGEPTMHWNAGAEFLNMPKAHPHQGYRHPIGPDDDAGLRALFSWQ
jgi:hypothetical protein